MPFQLYNYFLKWLFMLAAFDDQSLLIPEDSNLVSNGSNLEWDVPGEILTNGYNQHSSILHTKSAHSSERLHCSESCRRPEYFPKGFPNMAKSFSINSGLSSRTKDSFWGKRQNSIGNSLSFYNISSIFSSQDSA